MLSFLYGGYMRTSIKQVSLVGIVVLILSFLLVRFLLFDQHGMKQWPLILAVATLILMIIALWGRYKITSLFMSLSYLLGYFLSLVFQMSGVDPGGGRTSNQWILWAIFILLISLIGVIVEYFVTKRNKPIVR